MGYTILVVEDTLDSRELMKLVLEAEGYRVLEAANGVVAVGVAQREQPDAILMDMSLPLMDGCQATRRIRQVPALRSVPIIASPPTIDGTGAGERSWQAAPIF